MGILLLGMFVITVVGGIVGLVVVLVTQAQRRSAAYRPPWTGPVGPSGPVASPPAFAPAVGSPGPLAFAPPAGLSGPLASPTAPRTAGPFGSTGPTGPTGPMIPIARGPITAPSSVPAVVRGHTSADLASAIAPGGGRHRAL